MDKEYGKISSLFDALEEIFTIKQDNMVQIQRYLAEIQHQGIDDALHTMEDQLSGLLASLYTKLSHHRRNNTHQRDDEFEDVDITNLYPPNLQHEVQGGNNQQGHDIDDQEVGETPQDLLHQLHGYVKSTSMDIPHRTKFHNVLQSTQALLDSMPPSSVTNKHLNEYLSSLEGCIGSFTNIH